MILRLPLAWSKHALNRPRPCDSPRWWRLMVLALGCFCVSIADRSLADELPPVEDVDAATRSMLLIDGWVVDATTELPIKAFAVTPGPLSTDDEGRTTIRWRENLKREMNDGRLLWPRTSGFSVMRFRISADGYHPMVTQRIWRGGPHTRMQIRMRPTAPDANPPAN